MRGEVIAISHKVTGRFCMTETCNTSAFLCSQCLSDMLLKNTGVSTLFAFSTFLTITHANSFYVNTLHLTLYIDGERIVIVAVASYRTVDRWLTCSISIEEMLRTPAPSPGINTPD